MLSEKMVALQNALSTLELSDEILGFVKDLADEITLEDNQMNEFDTTDFENTISELRLKVEELKLKYFNRFMTGSDSQEQEQEQEQENDESDDFLTLDEILGKKESEEK